ncbi:MAG: hypothetical protein ACLQVI_08040 [Polyangiaceae bacterium]
MTESEWAIKRGGFGGTGRPPPLKASLPLSSRDAVLFDDVLGVVVLRIAEEEIASFDPLEEPGSDELFTELSARCALPREGDVEDVVGEKPVRRFVVPEVRERVHPVPTAVVTGADESRVRVHLH